MENNIYKPGTIALHGGYDIESTTKSVEVPIYLTNAYNFDDTEYGAKIFALEQPGNIYTRLMNPTTDVFEKRMTLLDGGIGALAFASGHAAIFNTVINLCQAGDEIVSSLNIYGGAINMLGVSLERLGITTRFVDPDDLNAWEDSVTGKTRLFFLETVGNPNANIPDLSAIAEIAHKHGIPAIMDSTFAPPVLCKPIDFGADIVIHSATKFLGGHGTVMGGIVVDSGKFNYKDNPRFPLFNQPDPSYHGLVYADLGETAFITRMRTLITRDLGAVISPFNAHQILQGIETLDLRMQRHCENTRKVALYLKTHPMVEFVNCPMLEDNQYYERAQKYMPRGTGSVFTFGLKGGRKSGTIFINSLKLFIHCANVGDTKSLVIHPATTTHSQLTSEQLKQSGISEETVRLSVGIEDCDDIIADLEQAISRCK